MNICPAFRPQEAAALTASTLASAKVTDAVCLLGERGYFRDSMGAPGRNDRGIYDDAIILHSPSAHVCFNANTDPSVTRTGVAVLQPGTWRYKLGIHGLSKPKDKQYQALVQADKVLVYRDGQGLDRGLFGINIHRGGVNGTSSLGCQTIYPAQWPAFIALVKAELAKHGQKTIPYLLIERQG